MPWPEPPCPRTSHSSGMGPCRVWMYQIIPCRPFESHFFCNIGLQWLLDWLISAIVPQSSSRGPGTHWAGCRSKKLSLLQRGYDLSQDCPVSVWPGTKCPLTIYHAGHTSPGLHAAWATCCAVLCCAAGTFPLLQHMAGTLLLHCASAPCLEHWSAFWPPPCCVMQWA